MVVIVWDETVEGIRRVSMTHIARTGVFVLPQVHVWMLGLQKADDDFGDDDPDLDLDLDADFDPIDAPLQVGRAGRAE